jgi:peroxiredoxin
MKPSKHWVLILGILSPVLAVILYALVYGVLTRFSQDIEKDWLFRLSASTLAMTIPFLFTLALAIADRRSRTLSRSGKIGLVLATLSLGLAWKPLSDGILRSKQARNIALHDVSAPLFDTLDTLGNTERLADQAGKVVLINIWATWCGPCRNEMPKLDRLYLARKDKGLVVFGLSDEDVSVQRKYLEKVPVSYPLLTQKGKCPTFTAILHVTLIFLIDRSGRLQPAPGPDQPFEKLQVAVDTLLNKRP